MHMTEAGSRLPVFQQRIYELRNEKGMSQADFAAYLGVSRATIGFYENGDRIPDALTLRNICQKCDVLSDWLIGLSEIKILSIDAVAINKKIGLSQESIGILEKCAKRKQELIEHGINSIEHIDIINNLLSAHEFFPLIEDFVAAISNGWNSDIPNKEDQLKSDYSLFMINQKTRRLLDSLSKIKW